jgi:hypothetical protein
MPDISSVHFDVALTNVSIAYRNMGFIARDIAPEVLVRRQSDRFFVYDPQRTSLRERDDLRAPGTEAAEVDFELSSETYFCDGHALAGIIPDEERENSDSPLRPQIDRVEYLSDRLLLGQELALARTLTDPTFATNNSTNEGTLWTADDFDPVARVETARQTIIQNAQVIPNTLVLSQPVYSALRNVAAVTDRVKYSRLGVIGTEDLAALFDVERVLIGRAVVQTTVDDEPVFSHVWGNDAFLMHVPTRPSLKSISPVLTFVWGQAAGSMRGWSVDTWREERRKSTAVRVQKYYDIKQVASSAFYWFKNAI